MHVAFNTCLKNTVIACLYNGKLIIVLHDCDIPKHTNTSCLSLINVQPYLLNI